MASEPKFTVEQVKKAIEGSYGIITNIAANLSCDTKTVYNYIKRYPELKELRMVEDKRCVDLAKSTLLKEMQIGGAPAVSASKYWLSKKAKDEGFGDEVKVEHSGSIGLKIESLDDDELDKKISELNGSKA